MPMPPGHAVGHEGVAEVVAIGDAVTSVTVGDRVVVPFQISCGTCAACRRGATGSCASLPLMAMYGMAPIAGLDGGGFMADLVLVPYADAMLIRCPTALDPVAVASLSDNIPDGWRTVGPYRAELAALDPADRRVLVVGRLRSGSTPRLRLGARGARRLRRHRPAAAGDRREARRHRARQPDTGPVVGAVPDHRAHHGDPGCWPRPCAPPGPTACAPTPASTSGPGRDAAALDVHQRSALRHWPVNARAVIPELLELLSDGCDLAPAVDRSCRGTMRRRRGRR